MDKIKKLTALCIALGIATLGCAAWGVLETMNVKTLTARVEALEASQDSGATDTTAADPEAVAARYDGGVITAAEASAAYGDIEAFLLDMGIDDPESAGASKEDMLQQLVEDRILEAKAKEAGVYELTDARRAEIEKDADAEFEAMIGEYSVYRAEPGMSDEELRKATIEFLEENDITKEGVLNDKLDSAWRDDLKALTIGEQKFTEDDLKAFWEERAEQDEAVYLASFEEYELAADYGNVLLFNPDGVRRINSILISFDDETMMKLFGMDDGTEISGDELEALFKPLEEKAAEVLKRIEAGESFDALQAEFGSIDMGTSYIGAKSTLYGDDYRDASMALEKPGDISAPVRTDLGVCLLRYDGDVPAGRVPFEDIKDSLQEEFRAEKESEIYNAQVEKWLEEAHVELFPDAF